MAFRNLANNSNRVLGPTAPRKRFFDAPSRLLENENSFTDRSLSVENHNSFIGISSSHHLTDISENKRLEIYENNVKGKFDFIVPFLKKISAIQYEENFVERANELSKTELGFELPDHILNKAWISHIDMKALFAWCVFQFHQKASDDFFNTDPLNGSEEKTESDTFQSFLNECGFHLLDVTPCADGRLAHTIAYVLRIPFSTVRRRSHAGALFDIEQTVNRWVKVEHKRYRESSPNPSTEPTRYLKVVTYHFSSIDPAHQGCAAHGSDDVAAASAGLQRLFDFREAVENTFCCGASVDLLLIGLDTDTDSIRVHVPSKDSKFDLAKWVSAQDIYLETQRLSFDDSMVVIDKRIKNVAPGETDKGMVTFIKKLIVNNISQIDYVSHLHKGPYPDAGHAERFIGVGIGFKEVHLRNLTYFAHMDTVEEGASDLDVGVKIFNGLNVARDLPIPIVVRFDYSGSVPHARNRAIADCLRINEAIKSRYRDLVDEGNLHTFLTIRDRDQKSPAEVVGCSLDPALQEAH